MSCLTIWGNFQAAVHGGWPRPFPLPPAVWECILHLPFSASSSYASVLVGADAACGECWMSLSSLPAVGDAQQGLLPVPLPVLGDK